MRTALSAVAIAILSSSCDAPSAPPVVLASPTEPAAVSEAARAAAIASGQDTFAPVRTPTSSRLDVDGDGRVTLQTDGLLIQRHIAGFTGDALIEGAVAPDCRRCAADEIAAYLSSL